MKSYAGTRSAATAAMLDMAAGDPRIVFVSSDSLKAMRADSFAQAYPDRCIEAGISEQSAVNIAAGLASAGMAPFVATYAGFLTMRACEQMRTFVAYPKLNVTFIGINAGLLGGEREGVTHQFYEDIAILSAIPNFTLLTPADPQQTYEAVKFASQIEGPVYVRAGSGREPDIFSEGTSFAAEGCRVMASHGDELLLLSSGFVLNRAIEATQSLAKAGFRVTLADVNIIGHDDPAALIRLIEKAKGIVTIEDHSIHGGLGAYIAELACRYHPVPMERIGLHTFGESGAADMLADQYGFSPEAIAQKAAQLSKRLGLCCKKSADADLNKKED